MASSFTPIEDVELYCRFCEKILPAQLDRSIAENGRTVDRNSTFEYLCSKCFKTACFTGSDLLDQESKSKEIRDYSPLEHFFIGEKINHKKFKKQGVVVGKDNGSSSKILVNFDKIGLKKLIQDLH